MKTLVTGGGGFLGLYLVEQLLQRGDDVRVFCRGQYESLNQLGVDIVQGDIRRTESVAEACAGMEAVFHVAAVPGVWGSWSKYHSINTLGTENVVAACRQHGVARLIYTSSTSVVFDGSDHIDADESLPYPDRWLCHYPHSKALGEQAVMAANNPDRLRTVALRPHLIWGPRDNHLIPRLIAKARSGRLRRVGDGSNVVSVSYVENAAAAHLQAEQSLRDSTAAAGRPYFINEPDAVNLWDWVDGLLERAGLPRTRADCSTLWPRETALVKRGRGFHEPDAKHCLEIRSKKALSAGTAYRIGATLEGVWKLLRLKGEPPMTRFVARQLAGSHSYSVAAAVRAFGYDPAVSMKEGLQRLTDHEGW